MVDVEGFVKTCLRCKVTMGNGVGINPTRPDELKRALSGPEPWITADQLRLNTVWKCPKCGHSIDMVKEPDEHDTHINDHDNIA